jgi:hypothetical protein
MSTLPDPLSARYNRSKNDTEKVATLVVEAACFCGYQVSTNPTDTITPSKPTGATKLKGRERIFTH